ncbi:hypothetical protein GCM10023160_18740 [Brachybacterium paraconglomeratum]|uniref:ribbon-helix-helix protein, CopG family n=1 Tax=Brachybacterium paraconglomeratum TaxID=173362 RepID=UPI0031E896D4
MATKEPDRSSVDSQVVDGTDTVGVDAPVAASAKPKRSSTRPISARVDGEILTLIDEAAARREMKRSELIEIALLQFISKGHAGALKPRVIVPGEVRHEVRAAQETMDELSVSMNRVGRNLLEQLKRHWADEPEAVGAAALAELEQASSALRAMHTELDRVAVDLRSVMDRPEW